MPCGEMSSRPHTPTWLARATFTPPTHYWSLNNVKIAQCGTADVTPALQRAKLCAESLIMSKIGMATLYETLELHEAKDDELDKAPRVSLSAVRETIETWFSAGNVFKYYIANWTDAVKLDACHYPPELPESAKEAGVVDGNIFLHHQVLLSLLLRSGRIVVLMTFIMHLERRCAA